MNTKKEKLKNLKSSSLLNHPKTTFTDGLPPNENMQVHFYAKFGRQPTTIPTAREACLPIRPGKKILKLDLGQKTNQCQGRPNNWARMSHEKTKFFTRKERMK